MHSSFSDGENSPEELVRRAQEKGMTHLGISDHGYAPYDTDCCIPLPLLAEHWDCLRALKLRCRDTLALYCGIEQDFYSDTPTEAYDYVIGSVHYLLCEGIYFAVDDTPERLRELCARGYGRDFYALAEDYYQTVGAVYERTRCDLIGHFDLISKFNEKVPLFDPAHPRYVAAWQGAADRLLATGRPFEINTGAMSRQWRTEPYPADPILRYLASRGARFVLSSDSHSAENLCFAFPEQLRRARRLGLELCPFSEVLRGKN